MSSIPLSEYIRTAYGPFFGGFPTPPAWIDEKDPDLLAELRSTRIVYHYTNAVGFDGIIRDGSVRASHYKWLNDTREVDYGYELANDVARDLEPCLGSTARHAFETQIDSLKKNGSFIASFSDRHDVLSQWRGYANDCAGYCIGFEAKPFYERYYGGFYSFRAFMRCRYGAQSIRTGLERRFRRKIARMARLLVRDPQWKEGRDHFLSKELAMVAWRFAHLGKHTHFREEREWRCIVPPPWGEGGGPSYRMGPRGVVPYVPIGLPIKEVWVGPGIGPSATAAVQATRDFLRHYRMAVDNVASWESSYVGR